MAQVNYTDDELELAEERANGNPDLEASLLSAINNNLPLPYWATADNDAEAADLESTENDLVTSAETEKKADAAFFDNLRAKQADAAAESNSGVVAWIARTGQETGDVVSNIVSNAGDALTNLANLPKTLVTGPIMWLAIGAVVLIVLVFVLKSSAKKVIA